MHYFGGVPQRPLHFFSRNFYFIDHLSLFFKGISKDRFLVRFSQIQEGDFFFTLWLKLHWPTFESYFEVEFFLFLEEIQT